VRRHKRPVPVVEEYRYRSTRRHGEVVITVAVEIAGCGRSGGALGSGNLSAFSTTYSSVRAGQDRVLAAEHWVEAWAADSEASVVQQDCDAAGARDGNVGLGIAVEVRNDEPGSHAVHIRMDWASKRAATFVEE
jgi:hypothetical protein